MSKVEEIKTYNKLLAEQKEYSFFSGKFLEADDPYGSNAKGKGKSFRKQSLEWMLALARVELGASIAMYGGVENSFQLVKPESFGVQEYNLLVADDAAAHMNAFSTDEIFKKRVRKPEVVDSDTLAYLRRLKVANDMLEYTKGTSAGSPELIEEMLAGITKARKEMSQLVEVATVNGELSSTESAVCPGENVYGNDIEAVSPIVFACQQFFLDGNSRREALSGSR